MSSPIARKTQLSPAERGSLSVVLRRPSLLGTEMLAGLVTSLVLIPEATAFAIVGGLDPRMGLFGAVIVAVVTSVLGGRPAMVSAAAGSVMLVAAPLVASHGVRYYLAAVILAGAFQVLLALCGAAKLMRFIPPAVMAGFVNALAILIFSSQLPELIGVPWAVYPLVAVGLMVVLLWPKVTRAVPAPLVAIVVVTVLALALGAHVPTVGDAGTMPDTLPTFAVPEVPWTADAARVIVPFAAAMAVVGLVESLLTADLVDELTETGSSKRREACALGIANVVAGLFGCMGGCAMIGQTIANVKAGGGRSRVSSFMAGAFVLLLALVLSGALAAIPMAALIAVMLYVAGTTFDVGSVSPRRIRLLPWSHTVVMAVTAVLTVLTQDLALGVVAGALLHASIQRFGGRREGPATPQGVEE